MCLLIATSMNQFQLEKESQSPNEVSGDDLPQVSEKNTKAQLTNAYKTLLKRYEEKIRGRQTEQAKKVADADIVKKASGYTTETTLQQIEDIKRAVERSLIEFSHNLINEEKRLGEVRKAINIEEARLKELYDIEAAAVELEDLMKAQEVKRETFEEECERIKTLREREKEEYEYGLSQEKKREEDARRAREEELKKREENIRMQEKEVAELHRKVEAFPSELAQETDRTKKETEERVKKEMSIQAELGTKEFEGEKKVLTTRITFFEELISKQNTEIGVLKRELEEATKQVQLIAEKAIDGAAGRQTLKAVSDIALQQAVRHQRAEN